MKTEHTPLPWKIGPVVGSRKIFSEDSVIAEAWPTTINLDEARANAEFILKACNSYYALVGACECFMREWRDTLNKDFTNSPLETVAEKCIAALALAEKDSVRLNKGPWIKGVQRK